MAGSTISLIVRATDGGNPPHSTSVPVTLNGKRRGMSTIDYLPLSVLPSDVPIPRFANSLYRFTVAEDAAVGFLVGRVQQIASGKREREREREELVM